MLEDKSIDLVVITTPNHLHYEQISKALKCKKHVLAEKPLVKSASQAKELFNLAKQEEKLLCVFHNRRFDSDFRTIQNAMADNDLGDIVYFESHFDRFSPNLKGNWRENKSQEAGGILYDLGPHLIDQSACLFGHLPLLFGDVCKQREGSQQDDYFHLVLGDERLRVVLHASCLVAKKGARFILHGTKGSLLVNDYDTQEQYLKSHKKILNGFEEQNLKALLKVNNKERNIEQRRGDYRHLYLDLYDSIVNKTKLSISEEDILYGLEIIEQVKDRAL